MIDVAAKRVLCADLCGDILADEYRVASNRGVESGDNVMDGSSAAAEFEALSSLPPTRRAPGISFRISEEGPETLRGLQRVTLSARRADGSNDVIRSPHVRCSS